MVSGILLVQVICILESREVKGYLFVNWEFQQPVITVIDNDHVLSKLNKSCKMIDNERLCEIKHHTVIC